MPERELQNLLKKDLSILAKIYASPAEEYICFSELPIGDGGRVDFAVFTGRSRMNVTLVEIKGADFNLATQSGTSKLSSRLETAYQQLKQREMHIYKNYDDFRFKMHDLRKKAEAGQQPHNALLGPEVPLQVDPQKHINLYFAIIGGRTVDNVRESELRHFREKDVVPRIQIDSWDSVLLKLRRR